MSHDRVAQAHSNGMVTDAVPTTQVIPRSTRRRFTAAYKLRILREAAQCTQPGQLGALLRREGLYTSHLSKWRRQRDRGQFDGLAPHKRGPQADGAAHQIAQLTRDTARLTAQLERAETIIEVQKKLSHLFGLSQADPRRTATR